jgi:hypothetical protein
MAWLCVLKHFKKAGGSEITHWSLFNLASSQCHAQNKAEWGQGPWLHGGQCQFHGGVSASRRHLAQSKA